MIRLCVLAFSAYAVVSLVSLQMEIAGRRSTLTSITEQAETQRLANKEIERQIALGDDKGYLARIAREKLDMGRADERVFRDAAGT
ncbi:septum formation initiator family protein [Anaerotruncus colihominis]|nr:septum formation initiator family protein [Anaerotruncus colihominis]